jgi:hypothetical protein
LFCGGTWKEFSFLERGKGRAMVFLRSEIGGAERCERDGDD